MTTIYFIRHAETLRSADSIFNDRTYPLSPKGLVDRKLVTEYLQDKSVDIVLSSPFKRAVDTVLEFAQQKGLEMELIEDFRERKIADTWIDDFKAFAKRQWTDFSYKQPDGENLADVQERNIAALNDVLDRYAGKNIAIGTHGTALSTIINYYDKSYGFEDFNAMVHIMPWVVKMTFDRDVLIALRKIDLFLPEQIPNYKNCKVVTAELGELKAYRYTVIFARYNDKWIYCRHKDRDVFETPGGSINEGESALEGAKRELYEETGAENFFITPAFDYAVHTEIEFSNGQVFYADIKTLGEMPKGFEMVEIRGFKTVPDKMRFPQILPVLYEKLHKWLGVEKAECEYWDVLDENRNPTGRIHKRTLDMPPGDYHLVVHVWIVNHKGEFLILRRAFNKIGYPGMWETVGGSALDGETSLEAAIREAHEESGIILLQENATLHSTYRGASSFSDVWLFRQEFELSDVVLQDGETIEARTATWKDIATMMECGEFIDRNVFREFDSLRDLG
ncbi:MAG: histidine phosphatase family protein [Defluviitaleaceae bacterium]|nr:histidine phosphatase family protein [Defluviitaleaceae bacterium]